MRRISVALFLVVVAICGQASSSSSPPEAFGRIFREPPPPPVTKISPRLIFDKRITQQLDNFDETNTETWEMRYFANSEFYVPGGPLFIYVGGEWEITYGWIQGGHMYDMAKEMNGYMFYTEHRFYGQSFPTSDASTDNLKYLDVNQALADLAHFIDEQRKALPGAANSGVILVGASYSATMVAWFKQAYPDKISGAWASSAPLFAKTDFVEYKNVVSDAIKQVGKEGCADRIERAIAELETQVNAGEMTTINQMFNPCSPLSVENSLDIFSFFSSISNRFAGLVQYLSKTALDQMCDSILDASIEDDVEALAKYIVPSGCYNVGYSAFVDYYLDSSWESSATLGAGRQWFYQTCNEFGWYQTSSSDQHIFGSKFPVDLYAEMCKDIYDGTFDLEKINANVLATNNRHNGFVPVLENVFFTHGQHDPWRPMGVQEPLNENTPTVILEGYAHCQDLYSISSADSEQMRQTKESVTAHVRKWLGFN